MLFNFAAIVLYLRHYDVIHIFQLETFEKGKYLAPEVGFAVDFMLDVNFPFRDVTT